MLKKAIPKKAKKACPTCIRLRWLTLYFACIVLVVIIFADEYLKNGS